MIYLLLFLNAFSLFISVERLRQNIIHKVSCEKEIFCIFFILVSLFIIFHKR